MTTPINPDPNRLRPYGKPRDAVREPLDSLSMKDGVVRPSSSVPLVDMIFCPSHYCAFSDPYRSIAVRRDSHHILSSVKHSLGWPTTVTLPSLRAYHFMKVLVENSIDTIYEATDDGHINSNAGRILVRSNIERGDVPLLVTSVEDNGCGVLEGVLKHWFAEERVSSRPEGKRFLGGDARGWAHGVIHPLRGSGGSVMVDSHDGSESCRLFIVDHKGRLCVEQSAGTRTKRGTCITIRFPLEYPDKTWCMSGIGERESPHDSSGVL